MYGLCVREGVKWGIHVQTLVCRCLYVRVHTCVHMHETECARSHVFARIHTYKTECACTHGACSHVPTHEPQCVHVHRCEQAATRTPWVTGAKGCSCGPGGRGREHSV